jgi:hypothetical protein
MAAANNYALPGRLEGGVMPQALMQAEGGYVWLSGQAAATRRYDYF